MTDLDAGWAAIGRGEYGEAERHFRAFMACAHSDEEQRQARYSLAYALAHLGHHDEAHALYRALRQDALERGDPYDEHRALHQVGMVERLAGRWDAALRTFEEERRLVGALGNPPLAVAVNAYELGVVSMHLGDLAAARHWLDLTLARAWESGDPIAVACAHRGLGDLHEKVGELDAAREQWHLALAAFGAAGDALGAREVRERLDK